MNITYHLHGIAVMLEEGLERSEETDRIAAIWINWQLSRGIKVRPSGRNSSLHSINFLNIDEVHTVETNPVPFIPVPLPEGIGKLYPMYGLRTHDITEEDIRMAQLFWTESVFIAKDEDGELYISD